MRLKELFEAQMKLDSHIIEEHKLQGQDLFSNKVVAFVVELSECANEIRFFKHWSNKGPSGKSVILEEFVDTLHFGLSIGNDLDSETIYEHDYTPRMTFGDFSDDFIKITNGIVAVNHGRKTDKLANFLYVELMEYLLGFAFKLGFTWKEIEMAYYKKNIKNHERQDEGY